MMSGNRLIQTILCVALLCSPAMAGAQWGVAAAGGDGSGTGGTISITYGQVDFMASTGSGGAISEGIQQAGRYGMMLCIGDTASVYDAPAGGYWSISDTLIATIDTGTGVVRGITAGVATITYTTGSVTATVPVTVNALPGIMTLTGGGSYCAGSTGVAVGLSGSDTGIYYQLYAGGSATGSATDGSGSAIDFGLQTAGGTYTAIATNAHTGCTSIMNDSIVVTITSAPMGFRVTGGGCYSGYAAIAIGLSGSVAGVNYQLYMGGSAVGSPVTGTGGAISFTPQTMTGHYKVIAMDTTTGCTDQMTDSASIGPVPAIVSVTGGGGYCSGGAGVHIGVAGSATGYYYQLYLGSTAVGSPVAGIGLALDLGMQTVAGTYTVVANYGTYACTSTMTGSATVTVYDLPDIHTVTGGGSYCAGGTGVHVGLNGSNAGVTYKLYAGSTLAFTLPGTGSALDYGLIATAETYTVTAMHSVTGCTSSMSGSAIVAIDPLPTITGGIYTVAPGAAITLTGSPAGGTWTSSVPSVATTDASGVVTGITLGATNISYTLPTGCARGQLVQVTPTGYREGKGGYSIAETRDLNIIPNPSKGVFNVKGKVGVNGDEAFGIRLTNMQGQTIYTDNGIAVHGILDLNIAPAGIAAGMYLLHVHTAAMDKVLHVVIAE